MRRRIFLQSLVSSSLVLLLPKYLEAQVLAPGHDVSFRCLGTIAGPARYLDGRTTNGTVGLAPALTKEFSGTKWHVFSAGPGKVRLKCMGVLAGNRWLNGVTANQSVNLAPSVNQPFTGTAWEVVQLDGNNPDIVSLKCLGSTEGPRWLDGRTANGTVGLAPKTDPPFTGTRWQVQMYPGRVD